jgi:UTP-glucose-1-phosphate uridylyltransferase
VLHRVLAHPGLKKLVLGGKGVGSQGDGTAQFLVANADAQKEAVRVLHDELGLEAIEVHIPAARRVRKAVIPAAGFGTRLYPLTKGVKKEMFPIVDRTGIVKPVLQVIIEEALESGIEEICVITQPGDDEELAAYFDQPLPPHAEGQVSPAAHEQYERLQEIGRRLTFVVQERQEGFGHAVYTAREWVGDAPFLLMLADHIYVSESEAPCARQLLDVYETHQRNVVALQRTPESRVERFGAASVERYENDRSVFMATRFAEKPTVGFAREYLRSEDLSSDEYFTMFGQYVLGPSVFTILDEMIRNAVREDGEFQLTTALERLRNSEGVLAYDMRGRRYDTGHPEGYIEAVNAFKIVPSHEVPAAD